MALTAEARLRAQDPAQGTVSRLISDPSGARVAGAAIVAACGMVERDTRADRRGAFTLRLPIGTCTLRVQAPGFATMVDSVTI